MSCLIILLTYWEHIRKWTVRNWERNRSQLADAIDRTWELLYKALLNSTMKNITFQVNLFIFVKSNKRYKPGINQSVSVFPKGSVSLQTQQSPLQTCSEARRKFGVKFPGRPVHNHSPIWRQAKRFKETGSVKNREVNRRRNILTEATLDEIGERNWTEITVSVWEQRQYADPLVGKPASQGRDRQPSVAARSIWELCICTIQSYTPHKAPHQTLPQFFFQGTAENASLLLKGLFCHCYSLLYLLLLILHPKYLKLSTFSTDSSLVRMPAFIGFLSITMAFVIFLTSII